MNSVYNLNLYRGQLLIKGTFSGSLECSLYTGLPVILLFVKKKWPHKTGDLLKEVQLI